MLDNIKQAWQHATHLFKAGHKVDAVKTFVTELWRGRRVKMQKNVFVPTELNDQGASIQGEYKKSNLAISKGKKQIDETMQRVRAATDDETSPTLSHIKTFSRNAYEDVDAGPEQKIRFDERVETRGRESDRAVSSSRSGNEKKAPSLYANTLRTLKDEGYECFEEDLKVFPNIKALADYRAYLHDKGYFYEKVQETWARAVNQKIADDMIQKKLHFLLKYSSTEAELKKSLEDELKELSEDGVLESTIEDFIGENVFGGNKPGLDAHELMNIRMLCTGFKQYLDIEALMEQVRANIQDELEAVDVTWQTIKDSRKEARANLYDDESVNCSSVEEANRVWADMPTKRSKKNKKEE